jgi:hypothetical protein
VSDEAEYVIIWEAPEIVKPEFRLYYDERGNVLFYTCEKPEGDYIVIDTQTYAEARPDVRVVDGRIVRDSASTLYARLHKSTDGTMCEVADISIITDIEGQYWKLKTVSL